MVRMSDFTGSKVALFYNNKLVVIQRDNKPGLAYAGMWDLPGGARDGSETPMQCAVREVREELAITLNPAKVIWQRTYPSLLEPDKVAYFMVAPLSRAQYEAIQFGDEGQGWKLITVEDFMSDQKVIGPFKERLKDYLENQNVRSIDI